MGLWNLKMIRNDQNPENGKRKVDLFHTRVHWPRVATLHINKCVHFLLGWESEREREGERGRERPQTVPVCRIILQWDWHLCLQRDLAALCLLLFQKHCCDVDVLLNPLRLLYCCFNLLEVTSFRQLWVYKARSLKLFAQVKNTIQNLKPNQRNCSIRLFIYLLWMFGSLRWDQQSQATHL